jgi:4-amino-4-deoxy-L-arabinose transferase-like glycosyltransferase
MAFKHRLKLYQWTLGILIIFFAVVTCYAATSEPSWTEHVDVVTVLISGLFIIVSWFVIQTLRKFESNQDVLFNKYNDLEKRVSHIEGAHEARTGQVCK